MEVRYLLKNIDGHVEMVVLHGGGGVDGSQRGPNVDHKLVVEAPADPDRATIRT